MKHYLYLEPGRIFYLCGRLEADGFAVKDARTVEISEDDGTEAYAGALRALGLSGKRVTAALGGSEVYLKEMHLPAASKRVTRRMICNEIAYLRKSDRPLAVDMDVLEAGRGAKGQHLLAYATGRSTLEAWMAAFREARVTCTGVFALPDCVAKLAARYGERDESAVVMALEPDKLRLYLVKGGHCLLNRSIRLNVRGFCEAGAEELLCEELADQVKKAAQFGEARPSGETPARVYLLTSGLGCADESGPGHADDLAECLDGLLKIPCEPVRFALRGDDGDNRDSEGSGKRREGSGHRRGGSGKRRDGDVHFGTLAVLSASCNRRGCRPVDFLASGQKAVRRTGRRSGNMGTRCLLAVGINALAVAAIWGYLEFETAKNMKYAGELSAEMAANGGDAIYRELLERRRETEQGREYQRQMKRSEQLVGRTKHLRLGDYQALSDCLAAGMEIRSLVLDGEKGLLSVRVSIPEPGAAPDYVERVRGCGRFAGVDHSGWEYGDETSGELSLELRVDLNAREGLPDASE